MKRAAAIILVEHSSRQCAQKDVDSYFALAEKMSAEVIYDCCDISAKELQFISEVLAFKKKLESGYKLEDYDVIIIMIAAHGDNQDRIMGKFGVWFPLSNLYNG